MVNKMFNQSGVIKSDAQDDLNVWPLPDVEQEQQKKDEKTNALGLKPAWRYEPPEQADDVEEVIPLTAEDIEQIRQAAYEEGFNQGKEEGFSKGYQEGLDKGHIEGQEKGQQEGFTKGFSDGEEQVNQVAEKWQQLVSQLHAPIAEVELNVEQQLLQLVAQLVEAVTYHEAKTNPDILMSALMEGMKALPAQEAQTQIRIHPDDIKLVESQFGAEYIAEKGWRLLPSPQLPQGSCQIENSTSNIDLSVKARLKEVVDSFLLEALHQ